MLPKTLQRVSKRSPLRHETSEPPFTLGALLLRVEAINKQCREKAC